MRKPDDCLYATGQLPYQSRVLEHFWGVVTTEGGRRTRIEKQVLTTFEPVFIRGREVSFGDPLSGRMEAVKAR
jgi:hypothetical protein